MKDECVLDLSGDQVKLDLPVRFTGGTYRATFKGHTATCTEGATAAVRAVLRKALGADVVAGLACGVTAHGTTMCWVTVTKVQS